MSEQFLESALLGDMKRSHINPIGNGRKVPLDIPTTLISAMARVPSFPMHINLTPYDYNPYVPEDTKRRQVRE